MAFHYFEFIKQMVRFKDFKRLFYSLGSRYNIVFICILILQILSTALDYFSVVRINSLSASHDNWCTGTTFKQGNHSTVGGDGDVGLARYEPALHPSSSTIWVLRCSNCRRSTHSSSRAWQSISVNVMQSFSNSTYSFCFCLSNVYDKALYLMYDNNVCVTCVELFFYHAMVALCWTRIVLLIDNNVCVTCVELFFYHAMVALCWTRIVLLIYMYPFHVYHVWQYFVARVYMWQQYWYHIYGTTVCIGCMVPQLVLYVWKHHWYCMHDILSICIKCITTLSVHVIMHPSCSLCCVRKVRHEVIVMCVYLCTVSFRTICW